MQRYKQLNPFNIRFTRTNRTCTEKNELQYSIQNDSAYTTSTIPPASFPVVLGDFGCDVTDNVTVTRAWFQASPSNSDSAN